MRTVLVALWSHIILKWGVGGHIRVESGVTGCRASMQVRVGFLDDATGDEFDGISGRKALTWELVA